MKEREETRKSSATVRKGDVEAPRPENSPSPNKKLFSKLRFSLNAPGTPNNAVAAGPRANKYARAL